MLGDPRLSRRFWKFVEVDYDSGCWLWRGALRRGYSTYWLDRRNAVGHIVAYETLVGPVPDGLELDHRCHDPEVCKLGEKCPHRRCVNPAHLKPTTQRVNTLRGGNPAAQFSRAARCVNGHEFNEKNTYMRPGGGRTCRECALDRSRKYRPLRTRTDLDTHCANGHERTPENLYVKPNGQRQCRQCNRERTREYRARQG